MKNLKHLFLLIISVATVTSCQKQPVANFTFDKDIYYAGDTIHLKDASTDAKKWKWTAPDGQTFTTKNLDYVIDSNDVGGYKSFTLEVSTKNGNKDSHNSDSVLVSQPILASDFIQIDSSLYPFHPTSKYSLSENGSWKMIATELSYNNLTSFIIYLPGNSAPSSGSYSLLSSNNGLISGTAYISFKSSNPDFAICYHSVSGILNISITQEGKIQAVFNNVNGEDCNYNPVTLNGSLTCF